MSRKLKSSRKKQPLSREALAVIATRFKAMSDPTRLELLQILMEGERSVQELCEHTRMSTANISKHLSILADQGIVSKRKDGLYSLYSISDPTVFELCDCVCRSIAKQYKKVQKEFLNLGS